MRFDTLNAGSYLVWRLQFADMVRDVRDDGDLILVDMKTGEQIIIYLIERQMSIQDIQYHLRTNGRDGLYTLFIFWVDMLLPRDGDVYLLDEWMQAILSVQGNRIYGFEVAGREAYFFPVFFDGTGTVRRVRYGNIVNYAMLSTAHIASDSAHLRGTWNMAGFDFEAQRTAGAGQVPPAHADNTPLGIYFQALGLAPNASLSAVKDAYRQLAREFHPDLNKSAEANHRMKQINDAYQRIVSYFGDRD